MEREAAPTHPRDLVAEFLACRVWAVVGASRSPAKWGYRVFRDLLDGGYRVYPVNPHAEEVLGHRAYATLAELPERPDVVECVVPPPVTEVVVRDCAALGIRRVWMQPGSESDEAVEFCRQRGIDVVAGRCVLVERRARAASPGSADG
jgi:predicted CoA-binding protein